MLFRDDKDQLVDIRKHNFTTDAAYYRAIMKVKQSVYKRHTTLNMNGGSLCVVKPPRVLPK